MPKNTTPRCYFSLRSPYSWLAHRELTETRPRLAERLDWVPFFEPDEESARALAEAGGRFPYSEMSRAKNMYVLQDVGRIAKSRSLAITWPVDRSPVWEVPHLAYFVAAEGGRGQEYIAAVYRARFGRGRDICDPATVAEIGTEIGVDPVALSTASQDAARRAEGVRALEEVCRDGVFGVPFFVHGFSRYWGLDRLAEFADRLGEGAEPAAAVPEPLVGAVGLGRSADDGHAGGCG